MLTGNPVADALKIIKDFVAGMQAVVALKHDGIGCLPGERIVE